MTGGARSHTLALAGGSAAAGVLSYVVFAVTTRTLGADAAAPVSVLWTLWAFTAAALTFPLQHWTLREAQTRGREAVAGALPRLLVGSAGVAAAVWLATALLGERLFHHPGPWFPVLAGLTTLGSALVGVMRGLLG